MPLISANLTYCVDSVSSCLPCRPKRVLTSPIASAADWKLVGIVSAMCLACVCICFNAPPDAPVFLVTVSIASSTSFHAATDAVATAATGTVTPLVSASPTPEIFPPTFLTFPPSSSNAAAWLLICVVVSLRAD